VSVLGLATVFVFPYRLLLVLALPLLAYIPIRSMLAGSWSYKRSIYRSNHLQPHNSPQQVSRGPIGLL
jgi:hypothetical protein